MEDSAWLASVRIVGGLEGQDIEEGIGERPKAQEGQGVQERQESRGSQVFLDFASDQSLIFHGDFGLFSFEKGEDGRWTEKVFVSDEGMGKEMGQGVEHLDDAHHDVVHPAAEVGHGRAVEHADDQLEHRGHQGHQDGHPGPHPHA